MLTLQRVWHSGAHVLLTGLCGAARLATDKTKRLDAGVAAGIDGCVAITQTGRQGVSDSLYHLSTRFDGLMDYLEDGCRARHR